MGSFISCLLVRLASTRDFYPALTTPVSPVQVQNIFFVAVHYFTSCVAIAQQPGQAIVRVACLCNMSLWVLP
jgi:hypothetical protein